MKSEISILRKLIRTGRFGGKELRKAFPQYLKPRKPRRLKCLISPKSKEGCRVNERQSELLSPLMRKPIGLRNYCMWKRLVLLGAK